MGGALPGRGLGRGRGPPIISGEASSALIAAPPGRERFPGALRVVGTSFLLITPTPYWVSTEETEVSASCRRRAKIVVKYAGDHYHHSWTERVRRCERKRPS